MGKLFVVIVAGAFMFVSPVLGNDAFEANYKAAYKELSALQPNATKLAPRALKIATVIQRNTPADEKLDELYTLLAEGTQNKDQEIGLAIHRLLATQPRDQAQATQTAHRAAEALQAAETAELAKAPKPPKRAAKDSKPKVQEHAAGAKPKAGKANTKTEKKPAKEKKAAGTNAAPDLKLLSYTIQTGTADTTNTTVVRAVSDEKTKAIYGSNALATINIENYRNGALIGTNVQAVYGTNDIIKNDIKLRTVTNYNAFFHFGSFILNPYNIVSTNGTDYSVKSGDTDAKLFLELVYNERWAWNSDRYSIADTKRGFLWKDWSTGYDFQGRLSYTFDGDDPTASTIVGSGDVAAEFTIAKHLWREPTTWSAQSFNLELSYGAVSDRNVFDVHHRVLVGPGYVASMNEPVLNNGRRVQFSARFGAAYLEHVDFIGNTQFVKTRNGVPRYKQDIGFGMETEVFYPILEQSFFTAGGRLYSNDGPNVWSMWIGFTTPLSKIGTLIPK